MGGSTVLVVLAHPVKGSFTAEWARATAAACDAAGHAVLWSDLYALNFDPAESRRHYPDGISATGGPLEWQFQAAKDGSLPQDVTAEVAKIREAGIIVFHFPLWWFGPPAILKGWFDRALAHGALHSGDRRFDRGLCRDKRALFCVSTGASEAEVGHDGKEGDIRLLLWPLAYALRYLGFTVLEPVLAHGAHPYHRPAGQAALDARLRDVLAEQAGVIAGLGGRPALRFNADSDFDADGRLRPDAPEYWPFTRHDPRGYG